VVAGSLLGNSFVAGRMTVAAANKSWLPSFLGRVGRIHFKVRPHRSVGDDRNQHAELGNAPV
jgi:solute carrier family 7 (L-type amino acid transporter), member 9/15